MEGFWTVAFKGIQGFGAGVATLIGGKVFGGDSGYLYTGTYTQQGNTLNARIHVKQYVQGVPNVMGRTEFDLILTGTLSGNTITATGTIPGAPGQLVGTLTKQQELPKAA
jgi:2-keto-4-pentenoate hydratase/2-oxohepta-3-ene-1,7-dioic acid hydratase in catechol pathway